MQRNIAGDILDNILELVMIDNHVEENQASCISESIINDVLDSVMFKSELRCNKCFLTHFPWKKICTKNNKQKNKSVENKQVKVAVHSNPKLKGGALGPKFLIMEHKKVQNILTITRSLAIFAEYLEHDKCPLQPKETKSSLCNFCLMRSLTIRANSLKGRNKIYPVEVFGDDLDYLQSIDEKSGIQYFLENIFNKLEPSPLYFFFDFDAKEYKDKNIEDLMQSVGMKGNEDITILVVTCEQGLSVNLNSRLSFDSRDWICKSVISKSKSFFYCNNNYYTVGEDENTISNEFAVKDATLLVFESVEQSVELDMSLAYNRDEILKLRTSTFDKRTGDRHNERTGDRHREKDDRHREKGDRHREKGDRHDFSRQTRRTKKRLEEEMKFDTGMDIVCSICLELKSKNACRNIAKVSREVIEKYYVECDLTLNADGNYYICSTCLISLKKGKEPVRAQKEFLGLMDFPDKFKNEVRKIVAPNKKSKTPEELNKLEDYLLKLVIPFITIRHLANSPYFKVSGDCIMISSNIIQSLNKILPSTQNLLPVSFKKKLQYSGHFIEEIVDRDKIHAYFNFFKEYNHLFKDYTFDFDSFSTYEKTTMDAIKKEDDPNSSDEDSDEEFQPEHGKAVFNTASLITDKYKEDSRIPTVANLFSDMIIQYETLSEEVRNDEVMFYDPEDEFYKEDEIHYSDEEDEIFNSDEEDEDNDEQLFNFDDLSDQDIEIYKKAKFIHKEIMPYTLQKLNKNCQCYLSKIIGFLAQLVFDLGDLEPESIELINFIKDSESTAEKLIAKARNVYHQKPECNHPVNDLTKFLDTILYDSKTKSGDLEKYLAEQRKAIEKNLRKISVAPGEEGKWKTWGKDLYLEEKCFPKLFPRGLGGLLSSNLIKCSNMGISNYVKSRLLSADPKFRRDPTYVFFLLLVKEMVDIKRSQQTYFRKATKVPNLNAKFIDENTKEFLTRHNNAFSTYKTIRGTAMYYEDIKKKLHAKIRQHGAPTLFCTLSAAEFD